MTTRPRNLHKPPFHPYSALTLVMADWLALGLNLLTVVKAYWLVSVGMTLAAAIAVFLVEYRVNHGSLRIAAIKAACALPVVLLPLPLLGTLVGSVMLTWSLAGYFSSRPTIRSKLQSSKR